MNKGKTMCKSLPGCPHANCVCLSFSFAPRVRHKQAELGPCRWLLGGERPELAVSPQLTPGGRDLGPRRLVCYIAKN